MPLQKYILQASRGSSLHSSKRRAWPLHRGCASRRRDAALADAGLAYEPKDPHRPYYPQREGL